MSRGWRGAAALLLGGFVLSASGHAASLRYCDRPLALNAAQKDKLFRLGGVIKSELDNSGRTVALMSRSGLDLSRFGQRYSHAGFSLKNSADTPWAIRQLYYACDEKRPRLYDQGVSGFLLGTEDPAIGYVSVVLMPPAESERLERAARDNRQALSLLGATYSANAYAFSLKYQNCNQWVAEMLAAAWGALPIDDGVRSQAQRWLQEKGYAPSLIDVGDRVLMWFSNLMPWLHSDDHPGEDLRQAHYRISMPASIEGFIQQTVPGATRLEFCHNDRHIVVRRGWAPIAEGCTPSDQDTVIPLTE